MVTARITLTNANPVLCSVCVRQSYLTQLHPSQPIMLIRAKAHHSACPHNGETSQSAIARPLSRKPYALESRDLVQRTLLPRLSTLSVVVSQISQPITCYGARVGCMHRLTVHTAVSAIMVITFIISSGKPPYRLLARNRPGSISPG